MAPCRVPPRLAAVRLGGPVGAAVGQGSRCHSCGLGVPRVLQHSRGAQGCHWVLGIPWVLKWGGALVLLGDWGSHCLSWGSGGPLGTTVGWGGRPVGTAGGLGVPQPLLGGLGVPWEPQRGGEASRGHYWGAGGATVTFGGWGSQDYWRGTGGPLGTTGVWGSPGY